MKDTLGNAIDTIQNIYGDRYAIHAIESPLFCPPANRRQPVTVEDSRFTSPRLWHRSPLGTITELSPFLTRLQNALY